MRTRLYVVVDREDETVVDEVKDSIHSICSAFSFSPSREQPTLRDCLDFYGTAEISDEEIDTLLKFLNNDWDGEREDCSAYGFNTKMFHPRVYYIQFQIM